MSFLVLHESRPLPSWLIFDVRRTMNSCSEEKLSGVRLEECEFKLKRAKHGSVAAAATPRWRRGPDAALTRPGHFGDQRPACAASARRWGQRAFHQRATLFSRAVNSRVQLPNKSPEPTPGSVTPRAVLGVIEVK